MVKAKRGIAVIMHCFFIFTFFSTGAAADCQFICSLKSNRVGPKPVTTEARGDVVFQLDEDRQELSYKLQVENIHDIYMAHLHIGPADKQGPIAVWLYPFDNTDAVERCIEGEYNGTLAEGVIKPENLRKGITFTELIEALYNGSAYVNVHTKKFIPGEIRGQVISSL